MEFARDDRSHIAKLGRIAAGEEHWDHDCKHARRIKKGLVAWHLLRGRNEADEAVMRQEPEMRLVNEAGDADH